LAAEVRVGWFLLAGVACQLPEPPTLSGLQVDVVLPTPVDADDDGYGVDVDCDDHDASTHPDADEVCLDGKNESCVDGADACIWSGVADIAGLEIGRAERGTNIGSPLALCDVNADGQLDLVMGGPAVQNETGAVYVFRGPLTSKTLDDADYTLLGTGPWMAAGSSLDCRGDVDGDGVTDLVVGEHGDAKVAPHGAAYLVSGDGADGGAIDEEATTILKGGYADDLYGYEVVALDDGDGLDDVAVTLWGVDDNRTQWGRTSVISDPGSGREPIETIASACVYGSGSGDWILGARDVGDLDGDGTEELAVVRRDDDAQFDSLYVFHERPNGPWSTDAADVRVSDAEEGFAQRVGHADLDGDGHEDLFSGNPDAGAVYVFLGPVTGDPSTTAADVRIYGDETDGAGAAVASPGDVSGDDVGDLLVGAKGVDAVYLIGGGTPGVYDLDKDAQAVLNGNHVGWSLATGEVTGDDITDFVITEFQLSGGGSGVVVMPSLDL
jgi:hypothetical protein